jgi:prepilin-type N-terminal cleavage/methylation domain-containing protein
MISHKKGFTLIELLIVISIISLISSIVLASVNTARQKSRDTARLQHVKTIQTALEMYYSDNGRYPDSISCAATSPNTSWCNSVQDYSNGRWIANGALAPYLSAEPIDPTPDASPDWGTFNGGTYFYASAGTQNGCQANQWYILTISFENRPDIMARDQMVWCDGTAYTTGYSVGNSVRK